MNLDFELDGSSTNPDQQAEAKVLLSVHTIIDIPVAPEDNVAEATRKYAERELSDDLAKFIDGCTIESEVIDDLKLNP